MLLCGSVTVEEGNKMELLESVYLLLLVQKYKY